MKVLRVHAPGTSRALADKVSRAVLEFNRGLDIRLRFLSIGIEETIVEAPDAAAAADAVAASAKQSPPDAVVVFGDGPAALAAATIAVRERAVLVRVGAGRREGADADAARAIDRMAALHLVHRPSDACALDAEGLGAPRVDVGDAEDPAAGDKIVRALSRARRSAPGAGAGASVGGPRTC